MLVCFFIADHFLKTGFICHAKLHNIEDYGLHDTQLTVLYFDVL